MRRFMTVASIVGALPQAEAIRQIRIDQKSRHASGHLSEAVPLIHQLGGKAQTCLYVFLFEARILTQDLFRAFASAQELQDALNRDPFAADRGFSVANGWVECDATIEETDCGGCHGCRVSDF